MYVPDCNIKLTTPT